jgi:hypothetical protein
MASANDFNLQRCSRRAAKGIQVTFEEHRVNEVENVAQENEDTRGDLLV